jgi:HEPN domain-containing protein
MKPGTREWLDAADADLQSAELLAAHGGPPSVICFHCQQAVEKWLKALIEERVGRPPRVHALPQLLSDCQRFEPTVSTLLPAAVTLNPYAVEVRYPPAQLRTTAAEATAAVDAAREVRRVIVPLL